MEPDGRPEEGRLATGPPRGGHGGAVVADGAAEEREGPRLGRRAGGERGQVRRLLMEYEPFRWRHFVAEGKGALNVQQSIEEVRSLILGGGFSCLGLAWA